MAALDSRLMVNGRTVTKKSASVGHSLHAAVTQLHPPAGGASPFRWSRGSAVFFMHVEKVEAKTPHMLSPFFPRTRKVRLTRYSTLYGGKFCEGEIFADSVKKRIYA